MKSGKAVKAKYSKDLDSMTQYIGSYLRMARDKKSISDTHRGIEDFCFNNNKKFTANFYKAIGTKPIKKKTTRVSAKLIDEFIEKLSSLDGESVFLLRDTQILLDKYRAKTNKGLGILVNRNYLCNKDDEQDYFTLISLLYSSLDKSSSLPEFMRCYQKAFEKLIKKDRRFFEKSLQIFKYIEKSAKEKIIWVDYGFQFTFTMFSYASVLYHSKGKIKQDFFNFTSYIWLQDFFQDKIFTRENGMVVNWELKAMKKYEQKLLDKSQACLLGFAIGDSLGFPAAGINKKDLAKYINLPIKSFQNSPKHPFFNHLKKGNYTDNCNFLILAAESIIKEKGFKLDSYIIDLVSWVDKIDSGQYLQRWAGPTALRAFRKLAQGISSKNSGSKDTVSCSCAWRTIPLGIYYRPFYHSDFAKLPVYAASSAKITHNSKLSITGAVFVSILISELINDAKAYRAVETACKTLNTSTNDKELIKKIQQAVIFSSSKSDSFARKHFGTGSPMIQTLPLSIFYFLKYQDNFEKAVCSAANSFRDDSKAEKKRIAHLDWEQQLREAIGGESNGIAALTGALAGAHLGKKNIPQKFLSVENQKYLSNLAIKLLA